MAKICPKEARTRALRVQTIAKPQKRAKASPEPNLEVSGPSFDRTAYQRVYCRLSRKHGPIADWPADALAELRKVSHGRKSNLSLDGS